MDKEKDNGSRNAGGGKGTLYVVGIGPGDAGDMTVRAREALAAADVIVGYTRYVELLGPLTEGKEIFSTGMTKEIERCKKALELAGAGRTVALVSSGDSGIYGMAGPVLELAATSTEPPTIVVVPGVPAFVSAASVLGSPLMHDFASVSLSDLLTPIETITKRIDRVADADFIIAIYNPRSRGRTTQLPMAIDIIRKYRKPSTPVAIVRNSSRSDESALVTTLGEVDKHYEEIDMSTILLVGNSTTDKKSGWMITPRGYNITNK